MIKTRNVVFPAAIILIILLGSLSPLSPHQLIDIARQKMSGATTNETFHLILYFALTFIILCSIDIKHHQRSTRYEVAATFLVLTIILFFSWVIEFCQEYFTAGRTYQQKDLIANSVGIAIGAIFHSIGSLLVISLIKIKMSLFKEENWEKVQSLNLKTKVNAFVMAPLVVGLALYLNTYLDSFLEIIIRSRSKGNEPDKIVITKSVIRPSKPKIDSIKPEQPEQPKPVVMTVASPISSHIKGIKMPPPEKAVIVKIPDDTSRAKSIPKPKTPIIVKQKSPIVVLSEKAESGHPASQFKLGCLYFQGNKVEKNLPKAIQLLETAAKNNHIDAQKFLAFCYQGGNSVKKNSKKSFEWFKKAAWQEDPEAQFQLGICYLNGLGTKQDLNKARFHLELAANNNYPDASLVIGKMYLHGIGTAKNINKANEYIKQAAKQGNLEAPKIIIDIQNKKP